jgi:hypothetical protein
MGLFFVVSAVAWKCLALDFYVVSIANTVKVRKCGPVT